MRPELDGQDVEARLPAKTRLRRVDEQANSTIVAIKNTLSCHFWMRQ
jgi:hypothetical protein